MSAIWTPPVDPTTATPATSDWARTSVTQNLRKLREDVDNVTSGAVVKVGYKVIDPTTAWDFEKTIVEGSFTMTDAANLAIIELNYTVRREAESNFLDETSRGFKSSIEWSTDGTTWNRPAEYDAKWVTGPDPSLRTLSEAVQLRYAFVPPAATFQVRSRHTAWSDAGSLIATNGGSWLTVMEVEAVAL